MQRRTWIKLGVVGGALLAVGGGLVAVSRRGWEPATAAGASSSGDAPAGHLSVAGRELFGAVAAVVLEGLLPDAADAPQAHAVAVNAHLQRLEVAINGLPAATQDEIAELSGLLLHPVGRVLLTGLRPDWAEAPLPALREAMQGLRESRLALRQQTYHALRDLSNGAYFSDPGAWAQIGYPGPQAV